VSSLGEVASGYISSSSTEVCGGTFSTNHGTPYHRLRSSPARFDRAVRMVVEGMTQAAAARAEGLSPSTLRRWIDRATSSAQAFSERTVRNVRPVEIQIDELRGYTSTKEDRAFVFAAIDVESRLWLASTVGRRTRRSCRLILRQARNRCTWTGLRVLIVTDPFKFYAPEIQETWSRAAVHVESGKIIRGGKIRRVDNKLVWGTQAQLEEVRSRCEDSKQLNTSYVERLNLSIRQGLACLHRRTSSAVKTHARLGALVDLLQCYYNFVRPHGRLRLGDEERTPAQQAKLVTRPLRLRDIFLAGRPWARRPWIVDEYVRRVWEGEVRCAVSNS
jgi:IS1 family transposase